MDKESTNAIIIIKKNTNVYICVDIYYKIKEKSKELD